MSMHVIKQWIMRLRKSARSKKSPLRSPQFMRVAFVSLVVIVSVAAIVIVAHQTTPAAAAAPVARAVTTASPSPAPAPAKRSNVGKANAANGATSAQVSEVVTITGCLEQKDDGFRLKDTGGGDAPKSRSWKTGFLTKHASSVTLVDGTKRLKLGSHVGERVSVTGTLIDKELQGRSLKALTPACD
jgi:hypothetical protein